MMTLALIRIEHPHREGLDLVGPYGFDFTGVKHHLPQGHVIERQIPEDVRQAAGGRQSAAEPAH